MDTAPKNGSIQFYEFFDVFIKALGVSNGNGQYYFKHTNQNGEEMRPLDCNDIVT